ncbi:MAG: hypothetical protein IAF08_03325 [Rhizobacter sp.]|nr:hypothetical protein [Chlorobiales bacterium]
MPENQISTTERGRSGRGGVITDVLYNIGVALDTGVYIAAKTVSDASRSVADSISEKTSSPSERKIKIDIEVQKP